ncbi:MAG TPA: hypothetical protein VFA43_00610 [Gemmatimonadaceae bacterium]|nr:hypothetical protein [Gemmatimonadaceae bacterium]
MRSHATIVAIVLAVLATAAILAAPESKSWADSGDVMFYLGAGESLAHGGGVKAPIGPWEGAAADSLTVSGHYPPGFSIALGSVIWLGASPDNAARIVRAVSLGITVALATLLVATIAGVGAGALAGLGVMISPFVVFTHTVVFSEPVFTVFVVATIALMVLRPDRPLAYGTTAALGLGVRLIGVALSGAAALWAFARPGSIGQRITRAMVAFAPSVIIEVICLWYVMAHHGGDARHFGWYGPAAPLFRKLIGINIWWLWPTPGAMTGLWVVTMKSVFTLLFILLIVAAWKRAEMEQRRLLVIVGMVFVLYNLVYITDRLVMDWPNNFELRNFSVVDVLLAMAAATSIGVLWPRQRTVLITGTATWMAAALYGSATFLRDAAKESREYVAEEQASPLLRWVRADRQHHEIYTNWNARVWRTTDRRTRNLPLIFNADTIRALGAAMARTHGVMIGWPSRLPLFSLKPEEMKDYAAPDTIAALLHLPVLVHSSEGTVWGSER